MKIKCRCSETRKTSYYHSSVGKSQNPCFNKKHTPNFLENEHFLPHVGMKCSFFRDSPFCLITDPVSMVFHADRDIKMDHSIFHTTLKKK